MDLKIIYQDDNILVIDKPAGIVVFDEETTKKTRETLVDLVLKQWPEVKNAGKPPRYGIIHRLDKDTSGIILAAKNEQALLFFQKQFKKRAVEKKYIALVCGNIDSKEGEIRTLIGRSPKDPKRQKVFSAQEPRAVGKREAVTYYKVIENLEEYALLEVSPKTGRKHQIRCHLAHIHHPIAGDKLYGFKNQPCPEDLTRHFLHASYLKIKMPDGGEKEFSSELPEDLKKVINHLSSKYAKQNRTI